MSIFDIFKQPQQPNGQPAATGTPGVTPPASAAPATPGNIPASSATATSGATAGSATNGVVPAGTDIKDTSKSPLDAFSDFWKNDTTNTNQPQPLFTATKDDMLAAASKADFKSLIKPEQLQAIGQGGDAAVSAFADALQTVAQNVYAQSAFATTKLIENAITKNNNNFKNEIPGIVKQHTVSDSLRTENPAFSHAAAQPIISAVESTLVQKFPNATASELRSMALDYLKSFAAVVSPPAAQNTSGNGGKPAETDWTSFLG